MVGLTGGIGSGKSAVAARLAQLGAVVADSDALARAAVAPGTPGLAEVLAEFGPAVQTASGELDRPGLARLVFADPAARRRLEAIVHPRVRAAVAQIAAAAPADAVLVNEVPLLVEAGLQDQYQLVIVVLASEHSRLARLVGPRDLTPEQAQARMRAQATDAQRRAVADVVITNDGSLAQLHDAVDRVWREQILPAAAVSRG